MDLSSIHPETQLNAHSSSSKRLVPDHQTDSNPRPWVIPEELEIGICHVGRFKPTSVGDTSHEPEHAIEHARFKPTDVGDTFLGLNYLYQKQKATGNPIALIISQVSDQSSHAIYVKP